LIFNDNDYGLISWKQQMHHAAPTGTQLTNPDFKRYAESFGIPGYRPQSVNELKKILAEAIKSRKLCLIEVPVETRVNMELSKKLGMLAGATPEA
jgi:acetolactate synthase I/II/III large subunit